MGGTDMSADYTKMAHTLFLEQAGLCDRIDIAGRGSFERRDDLLVDGVPTYHALDVSRAGQHRIMFWHPERQEENPNADGDYTTHGDDTWKVTDTLEHALH